MSTLKEQADEQRRTLRRSFPAATFLSYFAIGIIEFAIPFVAVSELGASALVLAVLGVCRFAPQVLLSGLAAKIVNSTNQRRVLVAAEIFRAAAFAIAALALFASPAATLVVFGIASVVMAWASTLTAVSTQVVVPAVFAGRELTTVYSRLSISESLGDGLAPFLSGIGISALGVSGTFAVSGVLALGACSFLVTVPRVLASSEDVDVDVGVGPSRGRKGLRNGLAINFSTAPMIALTIWAIAYNLGQSAIEPLVLISLLAATPVTVASYGLIRSVSVLFAVVGAAFAGRLPRAIRSGLGISVFGFAAISSYALVGLGVVLGGYEGLVVVFVGFAIDEFCSGVVLVLLQSYRGSTISLANRADAAATFRAACLLAIPVGLLAGGFSGIVLPPTTVIVFVGVAMIIPGMVLLARPVRSIVFA
ncbi:MFS transporter [Cryobacterium luteum]|uniref:MFS transporter n=1 Tax=Cryobacterium luteum TaxID=1424661 RepID=A0A1H8L8B8_9MICO|nr:MFS transporter [Cryobacterium luteum]TFB94444.1 MFS transporter [Cryobacterium luteum]SEO01412.1 Major Facilitator Superfamily protein [Cryobacterium luteum]